MYKRINDYGIIGNLGSCALVGLDGSIDWCCLPHLDSPSVFCALLDDNKGGRFRIAARGEYQSTQAYHKDTNILETTFTTPSGKVTVTDFMPFFDTEEEQGHPVIYRMVKGVSGTVSLDVTYQPRLDYARVRTDLRKDGLRITAKGNGTSLTLASTIPLDLHDEGAFAIHEIKAGERIMFVLGYGNSLNNAAEADDALEATTRAWGAWVHHCEESICVFGGPWHEMVVRSALTLKTLTHQHTGSIAAAATSSLPEEIGGVRN
jgi:GH15 family glucan-1,4-alpha-glucosidase